MPERRSQPVDGGVDVARLPGSFVAPDELREIVRRNNLTGALDQKTEHVEPERGEFNCVLIDPRLPRGNVHDNACWTSQGPPG